jgi:hypothetical protein
MKNCSLVVTILLILTSCAKDKPPVGDYIGTFKGNYTRDSVNIDYTQVYILQINESNKTSLTLQYQYHISELTKDNHNISGTLDFIEIRGGSEGHIWGPIEVHGSWKKEKSNYTISGNFSRLYTILSALDSTKFEFPIKGTFKIESNF